MEKKPWYLSSSGEGVAARLKALVPLVLGVASLLGLNLDPEGLNAFAGFVETLVTGLLLAGGAAWEIYGWVRHRDYKAKGLGKYAK